MAEAPARQIIALEMRGASHYTPAVLHCQHGVYARALISVDNREEGTIMSESDKERPVSVTGEERLHPAIRKLSRACIALARHVAGSAKPPADSADKRGAAGQDGRHD